MLEDLALTLLPNPNPLIAIPCSLLPTPDSLTPSPLLLSDSKFVNSLERRPAFPADHRPAVPTHQGVGNLQLASGTVEGFALAFL